MATIDSKLPDWMGVVLSGLIMLGTVGGVWVSITNDLTRAVTQVENVKTRVINNEEYDSFLQSQHDSLRDRVIRAESNIEYLNAGLTEATSSMRELTKEIRILNDRLTEVFIRQQVDREGSKNGQERTNQNRG